MVLCSQFSPAQTRLSTNSSPAAAKRPQVRFEGQQQSPPPSVQFGATENKGGSWFKRAVFSLVGLSTLGGYGFFSTNTSNPPGTHSVVYDGWNGGHQKHVYGPGRVYMGWKAAMPIMSGVHNASLNTSDQSVIEYITPSTQEGKVVPLLAVQVDFRVNPEYLHTLLADKLGGIKGDPTIPKGTYFAKVDDPHIIKLYLQMVRTSLLGSINDLATTYRGENFHTITDFLTVALNNGLKNYPVERLNGNIETKDIQSLQDQVGKLLIINKVHITEIKLPTDITTKLEKQATQPTETLINNLQTDLEGVKQVRNKAEGMVAAATKRETATQNANLHNLEETGLIQVATYTAEKNTIEAQATASNDAIRNEADKEATVIKAKASEEVAKIKAEAAKYAATTKAEADAQVTRLTGSAEAQAAKLRGEPYQKYPELLSLEALEGSSNALSALAKNPNASITYIDPKSGIKIDLMNIGGANGASTQGIINQIIGQRAATQHNVPAAPTPEGK